MTKPLLCCSMVLLAGGCGPGEQPGVFDASSRAAYGSQQVCQTDAECAGRPCRSGRCAEAAPVAPCGDGHCSREYHEDCRTCPTDCLPPSQDPCLQAECWKSTATGEYVARTVPSNEGEVCGHQCAGDADLKLKTMVCTNGTCSRGTLVELCNLGDPCLSYTCDAVAAQCGAEPNGSCAPTTPYCGDGQCTDQETCTSCTADCRWCANAVACTYGAQCLSGFCDPVWSICRDQPECGDGDCSGGEDCDTCPRDCLPMSDNPCREWQCVGGQPVEAWPREGVVCGYHCAGDAELKLKTMVCTQGECGTSGGTVLQLCNGGDPCMTYTCDPVAGRCGATAGTCPDPILCGDLACNGAETCASCAADCRCDQGEACSLAGQCEVPLPGSCAGVADGTPCGTYCGGLSGLKWKNKICQAGACEIGGPLIQACGGDNPNATYTCDADAGCGVILPVCGNGVLEPGEACDGGPYGGCSFCNADCQLVDFCSP